MSRQLNDETVKAFLLLQADNTSALRNYGYLLVSSDKQHNAEALHNIKRDFNNFLLENSVVETPTVTERVKVGKLKGEFVMYSNGKIEFEEEA